MLQFACLRYAGLACFPLHRFRNIANLQHNTHAYCLVPEDVAVHQPDACIIKRKPQNDIAVRLNIYSVFTKWRLCVEILGFLLCRAGLIGVVGTTQRKLTGTDDMKRISVLHIC